jgi:hypothetical protein
MKGFRTHHWQCMLLRCLAPCPGRAARLERWAGSRPAAPPAFPPPARLISTPPLPDQAQFLMLAACYRIRCKLFHPLRPGPVSSSENSTERPCRSSSCFRCAAPIDACVWALQHLDKRATVCFGIQTDSPLSSKHSAKYLLHHLRLNAPFCDHSCERELRRIQLQREGVTEQRRIRTAPKQALTRGKYLETAQYLGGCSWHERTSLSAVMQIHPSTYAYWQVRCEVVQLVLLQAAATKAGGQAHAL